jgi:microcystin-dependent protein
MSLSRVKVWERGEVLTYSDLNNEFNNILNNGSLLVQPWSGNFDLDGNVLILDANGDTSLDATVNDTIDVTIAGADDFRFTANTFTALSGSSITVASGNVNMTSGDLAFTAGRVLGAKGADVASASAVTVPTDANTFDLTGTTTITSFSTVQAGVTYRVRYTGAGLNVIHNATSLICPFGTDYRLVQNEVIDLLSLGSGNWVLIPVCGAPHAEPGLYLPGHFSTAPTGALLTDGTAVNCTTYHGLAKKLIPQASTLGNSGTSIGTLTANASTDEITVSAHGLSVNDIVHFTNTGGALPTGISANTVYYVQSVVSSTIFKISTTRGGSVLDITGAGSGTNTAHNKVNVPDLRGRVLIGLDNLGGSAASRITSASTNGANSTTLAGAGGAQTHTLVDAEVPSQQVTLTGYDGSVAGPTSGFVYYTTNQMTPVGSVTLTSEGGGGAHSNTQPWLAAGIAIRF